MRRETGNPLTVGRRYDPRALTEALVRAAGDVRLRQPFREAQVLATGGFGVRLARERGLLLRAAPWSEGDGLAYGLGRGAAQTAGMDEFYGRALPGPVREDEYVRASQLYARHALVLDDEGRDLGEPPGTRATSSSASRAGRRGTSSTRGRCASRCGSGRWPTSSTRRATVGGDVRPAEQLPFELPASPKLAEPPFLAVRVYAGVTHTIGGLRIDDRARVLDGDGSPVPISTRRAPMPAGSSPAATAAASPRPSSTAASPPRLRWARRAACRRRGGGRRGAARGRSC